MVAVSARMIAQLAVADGYEVTALDRFGDVDLRAIAPGATASSNDALAALATGIDADAVVYGGGLENRPDLVAQLAGGRELLGTPAELLDAVRDPWAIGRRCPCGGGAGPGDPVDRRAPRRCSGIKRMAAKAAARWRRAWRAPLDGRPAAYDRDPAAPCRRAVVLGGGDRRRAATPPCSASPSSCIARRASGGPAT